MNIDRLIRYVPVQQNDGSVKAPTVATRIPISLPRVSCLEDPLPGEIKKYYRPEELGVEVFRKPAMAKSELAMRALQAKLLSPLTPRERDVNFMLNQGLSIEQIAKQYGTSVKNVRGTVSMLTRKLCAQAQEK